MNRLFPRVGRSAKTLLCTAALAISLSCVAVVGCSDDDDNAPATSAAATLEANSTQTVTVGQGPIAGASVTFTGLANTAVVSVRGAVPGVASNFTALSSAVDFSATDPTSTNIDIGFTSAVITVPYALTSGVTDAEVVLLREDDSGNVTSVTPDSVSGGVITATVTGFSKFWPAFKNGNDAPIANTDAGTVDNGSTVDISVLDNDTDGDAADVLEVTAVTQGANGTVSIIGGTQVRYDSSGVVGLDSFTYTVSDGMDTATATVNVAVMPTDTKVQLIELGRYETGTFDESAAENVAYDSATQRAFVVNANDDRIDVLDISDPTNPMALTPLSVAPFSPNSVAVSDGVVAVAAENADKQATGKCFFFNAEGTELNSLDAGALPDMVTFTPDGTKVLLANEGEPNADYDNDPEGTVTVIDISGGDIGALTAANVTHINFQGFNTEEARIESEGGRIFGPGASVAQDLEPEYIAISPDSTTAYVAMQENNALAIIDLSNNSVSALVGLGLKDHSITGNGLDASDRDLIDVNGDDDKRVNISTWPFKGYYQPDSIDTIEVGGQVYVLSANEGDAREYEGTPGFIEEARVKDVTLDPAVFGDVDWTNDARIGRKNFSAATSPQGGNGYTEIHTFGARSFSVWNGTDGSLVWDSGDFIERYLGQNYPEVFNSSNDETGLDDRSDNKGPEPEALEIVENLNGRSYALLGLERIGGIMVFDITDPTDPSFVQYTTNRDFDADPTDSSVSGDLGPEGILYVSASGSSIPGLPLVLVASEVSGTFTVYGAFSSANFNETVIPEVSATHLSTSFAPDATFGDSFAEIVEYDPVTEQFFVIDAGGDRISVYDVDSQGNLSFDQTIDTSAMGSPNSVDVYNPDASTGWLAVALENPSDTGGAGSVALYDTSTLGLVASVNVGVLPDMVTFTPDGSRILTANEGQPFWNSDTTTLTDPEGSISIITLPADPANLQQSDVATADFSSFNRATLEAAGVRILDVMDVQGSGLNMVPTAAESLQPEYIAVSSDSSTAYVTLQENNAIAVVNIATATVSDVLPLGLKNHNLVGMGLDGSDRDADGNGGRIHIAQWPVWGMYQPDTIKSASIGGTTYLFMANEGDALEIADEGSADDPYEEDVRMDDITLDPDTFGTAWAAWLQDDDQIGRLGVTPLSGDTDSDGDIDVIHVFGGRSFTIRDTSGAIVWDSGDFFERWYAIQPEFRDWFNSNDDENEFESRSDNKGPEPEALEVGVIDGRTYAFIGMERQGGIFVFDVTDPQNPVYRTHMIRRDFTGDLEAQFAADKGTNDLAPEGLTFIPAASSPTGTNVLAVANEVSGTLTLWELTVQ